MGKSELIIAFGILIVFLGVSVLALNSFSLFKDYQKLQLSPIQCEEGQCAMRDKCIDNGDTKPNNPCKICINGVFEDNIECSGSIEYPAIPPSCNESQIIMRLSNTTNAHGALWNDSRYNVKVCFSNIFGFKYKTTDNENPHECNSDKGERNRVIDLAETSNAHAEKKNKKGYETKICYGDLKCKIANKTESCSDFGKRYKKVVSLSNKKDAHISIGEDYNISVCCKTDQGHIEEPTDGCSEGTTLCSDGTCQTSCEEFECNNNNICEENEGCQCADCHGFRDSCSPSNELICDFRTDTCQPCPEGTTYNQDSGACEPDSSPQILIVKPEKASSPRNWKKFKVNTGINFEQISSNLRKDLSVTWNFKDGNISTFRNCLSSGNCNTTHEYRVHGHYTVDAIAREQGGFRSAGDYVDFLVYREGLNVFAIITEPVYGAIIPSGQAIRFNANESFVAECFTSSAACSQASFNIPCYSVVDLSCYNLPRPGEPGFNNFNYEFFFNWTFDKDTNQTASLYGKWNNQYNQVVNFERIFTGEQGTNHTAQLIVKYRKET
ncbi:MAG: hypothetical protein QXI33_02380 [Candidatus Pacearchaeota archaeon]